MPPDRRAPLRAKALISGRVDRSMVYVPHSGHRQTWVAVDFAVTFRGGLLVVLPLLPVLVIRGNGSPWMVGAVLALSAAADRSHVVYRRLRSG